MPEIKFYRLHYYQTKYLILIQIKMIEILEYQFKRMCRISLFHKFKDLFLKAIIFLIMFIVLKYINSKKQNA